MSYKSIVNELDKFFAERPISCLGCPLEGFAFDENDSSFAEKLIKEFNIESKCIVNFFYKIKDALSEDKIIFLLKELKENNIQYIDCNSYKGPFRFLKILKNTCVNLLEIE